MNMDRRSLVERQVEWLREYAKHEADLPKRRLREAASTLEAYERVANVVRSHHEANHGTGGGPFSAPNPIAIEACRDPRCQAVAGAQQEGRSERAATSFGLCCLIGTRHLAAATPSDDIPMTPPSAPLGPEQASSRSSAGEKK